ncbi:MAG TPA: PAS domain S-box protein [Armatimonadota bacterium]|nr:PAS domain S-box protein [Armatimonadota bacterium]
MDTSDSGQVGRRAAGERLERLAPELMRRWEEAARRTIPAAGGESGPALRDGLPTFLEELAASLQRDDEQPSAAETDQAREHAEQRAGLDAYTLEQVLQEYHLLEEVLFEALEAEGPLAADARLRLRRGIQRAVEAAATRYVRATRQAIRQIEQPYRLLVESARDFAILTLDPEGRITTWNPGAERILGYTEGEAVGQPNALIFTPEDRERGAPEDEIATACREGQAMDERWHLRKDGSRFFASGVLAAMRDGEVYGYAKVMRDITERKVREEELEWVMAGARCLLWSAEVFDTDHPQYLHWEQTIFSEAAAQQFIPLPLQPGELYRQGWYRCRLPEDRDRCDARSTRFVRAGKSYEQEFRVDCADGTIRWVREDIHVETVVPGAHWHIVAVATDLTERKHLEQELRARADALAEADRRKNDFLAMLAHELRNPLGAIRNAIQVIDQAEPQSPPFLRAVEVARRQIRHQSQIVEDLLDLSRITRGKLELRRQRLDLRPVVRDAAEDFRRDVERAGLALTVEVPPEPVPVRGDPTRLAQVVGNLVHNAVKFTPAGGVTVELLLESQERRDADGRPVPTHPLRPKADAHVAVVRVRDTGIGIDPSVLTRLFEPFTQADSSLDRARGGLGLGLALVKGLVEMHGGEVWVYSAGVDRGTEFTFYLPLDHEPAGSEPAPGETVSKARPLRILVIEDIPDAADTLRDLLELSGYEVEVAYSGPTGLEAAERFQPRIVLCDIGLPGMDGYTVAEELRRRPSTAAATLIALTGYSQDDDRRRAATSGFDLHLTKPVDPEELQRVLASVSA